MSAGNDSGDRVRRAPRPWEPVPDEPTEDTDAPQDTVSTEGTEPPEDAVADDAEVPSEEPFETEASDQKDDDGPPDEATPLVDGPGSLDLFSSDDYVTASTREYRGLAEEVAQADSVEYERQAVAASMPGMDSGLIGFEDVTGRPGLTEEEIEREEQQRSSDLTLRVATGIVLVGLFIGSLLLGGVWFTGFVGLAMLVSLGEFYATVRTRGYVPVSILGLLGAVGVTIGAHRVGPYAVFAVVAATTAVVAMFYAIVPRRRPLENAALTVMGLAWVAPIAFAIVIGRSERAVALVLLVVLVSAFHDSAAYFAGRAFGKRLLAPTVSPKKTVEGLIGGIVGAFVLTAILSTFPPFDPLDLSGALVFAAMVSVLAPLGDAAESVVKRALDTKDMGSILPGHGGMLDRIDSLLFVVPAAYYLFDIAGYL